MRVGLWRAEGFTRGEGVGGRTESGGRGAWDELSSLSLSKSQWLFSNCVSDAWYLRKIWKIKESNKNKEESLRLFHRF